MSQPENIPTHKAWTKTAWKETARAKVNLTLHVGTVQENGYHPLHSLVVFADIGDALDAELAEDFSLKIKGPFANDTPGGAENLVIEAAKVTAAHNHITAKLAYTLDKKLPVSSGIGGGSADAAAALKLLSHANHADWSKHTESFLPFGADVPVCYLSRTCVMEGIGEEILPWPGLGQIPAVLINPGVGVSTKDVFNKFDNVGVSSDFTLPTGSLYEMAMSGNNDLQATAIQMQPEIKTVLDEIAAQADCQLARMSGSGATCFGLFISPQKAAQAAKTISKAHADWWCVSTMLGDPS